MKILMVLVAAAMMWYLLMQQGSSASVQPAGQGSCVDALHAQYAPQWADMNELQRAMVGLQAAGCAP